MESECKLPTSQINYWKESSFANTDSFRAQKFKITQSNVRLFWDRLPLIEKEECLLLCNQELIHLLNSYIGMLEFNYFQVYFFSSLFYKFFL